MASPTFSTSSSWASFLSVRKSLSRPVGQHDRRNAEPLDGVGRSGGARHQLAGFAHYGVLAREAGHAGSYDQMGLFFERHGFHHLVDRGPAQLRHLRAAGGHGRGKQGEYDWFVHFGSGWII